jgi:sporulation protein YlmC with PRC-barrel domain
MRTRQIIIGSAAFLLALGFNTASAQQYGDRLAPHAIHGDRTGFDMRTEQPHAANRASEIIGMRVENQFNERLGTVRDVVFDFRTGRIAYVVLARPDPRGERFIAVPPAALHATHDQNRVFLNIDRERLARVPGFDRHNWPDIDQPFWGAEGIWGPTMEAVREPVRPGWERERFAREQIDRPDRFDRTERFDRMDRFDRTERWRDADEGSFRGTVTAINPEARTISIRSETGEVRHFEFGERPNIQLFNMRYPRMVDVRVGFPVNVGYRVDRDGTLVAHTLIRTDRPEVR